MEKLSNKTKWLKENWFIFLLVGWTIIGDYFNKYIPDYLFLLTAFWIGWWLILNFIVIINEIKAIEENSFLKFLKRMSLVNAIIVVGFGASQLLIYFESIVPESVLSVLPITLILVLIFLLVGILFHFVEKSTNK